MEPNTDSIPSSASRAFASCSLGSVDVRATEWVSLPISITPCDLPVDSVELGSAAVRALLAVDRT